MCRTKMPGVWTASGSISPGSTRCSTSASVTRGGGGHHRVEVARGLPIHEVAVAVALPRAHEREVRLERQLEHVGSSVDHARLLALGHQRAVAGRREEAADACPAGANALRERALRHQLDLELAGEELPLELAVLADVGRDHLADLPGLEQTAQAEVVDAGVVADHGEAAVPRAWSAASRFSGLPQTPKPPTITVAPSGICATASCAERMTLSMPDYGSRPPARSQEIRRSGEHRRPGDRRSEGQFPGLTAHKRPGDQEGLPG